MHNAILSTFVKKKILFFILKLIIFISVSFLEIQSSEIIVIKGAFVNRTCQFIVGRSIKTTSTVPFINLVKLFVLLNEIMNSNTHLQQIQIKFFGDKSCSEDKGTDYSLLALS